MFSELPYFIFKIVFIYCLLCVKAIMILDTVQLLH